MIAVLVTGGYVVYNYQRFTSGISHIDAITHSNAPATDADGTDQNILLVGDDHRPANATAEQLAQLGTEDDGGATNTDTMMVCTFRPGRVAPPCSAVSGSSFKTFSPTESEEKLPNNARHGPCV